MFVCCFKYCFVCIITVLSSLSTADHQGDGCMDKIVCYVEEAWDERCMDEIVCVCVCVCVYACKDWDSRILRTILERV